MIQAFSFGHIQIDGTVYTSDILIFPDGRVEDSWWRKEGHRLASVDIEELIIDRPEFIIAGTGASGLMKPKKELISKLADMGISFIVLPSPEAIHTFNDLAANHRLAACFHLTC